jgi:hypothetical protein
MNLPPYRTLDRSFAVRPDDPQAWLTRATVLRVLVAFLQAADAFPICAIDGPGIGHLRECPGVTGQLGRAYHRLAGTFDPSTRC